MTTQTTKFWRWLLRDDRLTRVVRVKSLWPSWDRYYGALAWPVLLVDRGPQRSTITPIWTSDRWMFWKKYD